MKFKNIMKRLTILSLIVFAQIVTVSVILVQPASAVEAADDKSSWTIHFKPGIRWGTDNRTLYILDFLVPLYQDEKNILFVNTKYTPNDLNGWELNLGIEYRHIPCFRINSLIDIPASTSFKTPMICSSVKRFFFI